MTNTTKKFQSNFQGRELRVETNERGEKLVTTFQNWKNGEFTRLHVSGDTWRTRQEDVESDLRKKTEELLFLGFVEVK